MTFTEPSGPWVVYQVVHRGHYTPTNAVCAQTEWDALEQIRPGHQPLIRSGITHQAEAERLARGTSGDSYRGTGRRQGPQPRPETPRGT